MREGGNQGGHRRLGGGAGQGCGGGVDSIGTGVGGGQVGGQLTTRGVVGVHVHGQVEFAAQGGDQLGRRGRAQQAGHVLDGQNVGAGFDDLLGQLQVVVQGVELLPRVGQITGVRHGDLGDAGAGLQDGVDGRAHLGDVVERIEDPEDVHAGLGGLLHKRAAHRIGVRGVTDGVAATQQHLDVHIRHGLAQLIQACPRILEEEAHGHVVGGTAPGLHGQQLRGELCDGTRRRGQREGAHAGGQEGLVGVTEGGVGDGQGILFAQIPGESLRAELLQAVAGAAWQRDVLHLGQLLHGTGCLGAVAVGLVHGDIRQVFQDPSLLIIGRWGLEQVLVGADEAGVDAPLGEVLLAQQCAEEADVGGHTGDIELGQGALGAGHGGVEVGAAAGHLDQHGVEVRGDLAAELGCAVETHTRTTRGAVGGDHTGVGSEVVGRILRGDAALQGGTVRGDLVLGQAQFLQGGAGGQVHLRLDQVDGGDLLGHGVLHLDAGVHLDEDVVARLIHQELHGAGTLVSDEFAELHGIRADAVTQFRVEVLGRGDLDDFLVTALQGAVAFIQVDDITGVIAQDLHLDVLGFDHGPLDVDGAVTEGGLGLTGGLPGQLAQVLGLLDEPHAAPATTGDGLDEDRVGLSLGTLDDLIDVGAGGGFRQDGQAGLLRGGDSLGLVTREVEHLRGGADEGNAVLRAFTRELGVFRKETITRVDRVRFHLLGGIDDLINIEVRLDGRALGSDPHRLGGKGAVEGATVLPRVDGHGCGPGLIGGTECPHRDFTSVGHQDLFERGQRGGCCCYHCFCSFRRVPACWVMAVTL